MKKWINILDEPTRNSGLNTPNQRIKIREGIWYERHSRYLAAGTVEKETWKIYSFEILSFSKLIFFNFLMALEWNWN